MRYIQFFLLFIMIITAYGMRSNLSVGIVAMTGNSTESNSDAPVSIQTQLISQTPQN